VVLRSAPVWHRGGCSPSRGRVRARERGGKLRSRAMGAGDRPGRRVTLHRPWARGPRSGGRGQPTGRHGLHRGPNPGGEKRLLALRASSGDGRPLGPRTTIVLLIRRARQVESTRAGLGWATGGDGDFEGTTLYEGKGTSVLQPIKPGPGPGFGSSEPRVQCREPSRRGVSTGPTGTRAGCSTRARPTSRGYCRPSLGSGTKKDEG